MPTIEIDLAPEISEALQTGRPVVALESTIVAHGMPFPENLTTAQAVEAAVREGGAVPATIAVIAGRCAVGLDGEQLERIAAGQDVQKASVRDLAALAARGLDGATTVAATMRIASLAGIRVFATGGIGGVHRGADRTFDVSADLTELSLTQVAVVCAGAKAILDIPATLEVLDTLSVPVVTLGQAEFPAFYSRSSGVPSHLSAGTAEDVARICAAHWSVGGAGGILVGNPIDADDEIRPEAIAGAIDDALRDADAAGIAGKDVTPFLLARVAALTGGDSLRANVALVLSNARLAARLAVAFSR